MIGHQNVVILNEVKDLLFSDTNPLYVSRVPHLHRVLSGKGGILCIYSL
jgi:hypothetical protein